MGFYIPASWLQGIHYYYFCIGMFSFASSVMFGAYPGYAMIFVVSYVLNSGVCWYLSWWVPGAGTNGTRRAMKLSGSTIFMSAA